LPFSIHRSAAKVSDAVTQVPLAMRVRMARCP
jgi:hypothetical protein